MKRSLVSLAGAMLAIAGCNCSGNPEVDAGDCPEGSICLPPDAGGNEDDAGMRDAGPRPDVPSTECDIFAVGRNLGSACRSDVCQDPWECLVETPGASLESVNPDGSAGPNLSATIFPNGGECSTPCLLDPADAADLNAECGDCGACSGIQIGRIGLILDTMGPGNTARGLCRPFCTPSQTDNGGCREEYTCDVNSGTCGEACTSDMQCRFGVDDIDGDGGGEIVYLGDTFPASCNLTTGRCDVMGTAGARPGDPCTGDADCEDNGLCITGDAWPGGYCSRLGCHWPGFECGTGAVCDVRSFGDVTVCLDGCQVGEEDGMAGLVTGDAGHATDCAPGFACFWDGATADPAADPNGGCIPAEYNSRTVPNTGGVCQTDADCYSPFGYGRCFFAGGDLDGDETNAEIDSGICVISNCAVFENAGGMPVDGLLPGVETTTPVCNSQGSGATDICLNFSGMDEPPATFCLQRCTDAAECAPGYACLEITTAGDRICWPFCAADADCRGAATCETEAGAACPADGSQTCFCSDRMPPVIMTDAGMPMTDAGMADAGPITP